jgi:hypothetical protein
MPPPHGDESSGAHHRQLHAKGRGPRCATPEFARKYVLAEQLQWAMLIRESDMKF